MSGELRSFNFEGQTLIRMVIGEDGEPRWVAKDVAEALGYKIPSGAGKIIAHIPAEWRGGDRIPTPSGAQDMSTLTEQGLYFFLARSNKPKALPFQKWLAGEVLPALRKTGSYSVPQPSTESAWATVPAASKRTGISDGAVRGRIERHQIATRMKDGKLHLLVEGLLESLRKEPLKMQGPSPLGTTLPDAALLAEVRQIYGPERAQAVLHQLAPKLFPAPAVLEGGAK